MIPVLIDCDPGQDDAIALLLALASPELEVRGITTVAGNQTLDKTTTNALRVLALAGREDIPVAAGADGPLEGKLVTAAEAHGETGLDGPDLPLPRQAVEEHAVDFLGERVEGTTLIALGPLTNIALLLEQRAERPDRMVLMGGAIAEGNMTASAEFNIWVDPEAAHRVFTSGLDVTMVGLDVTNRAVLTPEHAAHFRESGPVGAAVAAMLDFYLGFYLAAYDHGGAPIHDALAVAHVIRPELVQTLQRHVEIDHGPGLCRGRTVVDIRRRIALPEPNARVAVDVDVEGFRELLLERLANFPSEGASRPH